MKQLLGVDLLCIGLSSLISDYPQLANTELTGTICRKDIGKKKKLRRWSRGHQFIVRAGGHIDAWQPLYQ